MYFSKKSQNTNNNKNHTFKPKEICRSKIKKSKNLYHVIDCVQFSSNKNCVTKNGYLLLTTTTVAGAESVANRTSSTNNKQTISVIFIAIDFNTTIFTR